MTGRPVPAEMDAALLREFGELTVLEVEPAGEARSEQRPVDLELPGQCALRSLGAWDDVHKACQLHRPQRELGVDLRKGRDVEHGALRVERGLLTARRRGRKPEPRQRKTTFFEHDRLRARSELDPITLTCEIPFG